MALTSDQRKKLDALEKALTKAQDTLPPVTADTDQAATRDVLRQVRALLGQVDDVRARD